MINDDVALIIIDLPHSRDSLPQGSIYSPNLHIWFLNGSTQQWDILHIIKHFKTQLADKYSIILSQMCWYIIFSLCYLIWLQTLDLIVLVANYCPLCYAQLLTKPWISFQPRINLTRILPDYNTLHFGHFSSFRHHITKPGSDCYFESIDLSES